MWMALRSYRHHRAILGTFGRVLLPPWAALLLVFFVPLHRGVSVGVLQLAIALWFILGLGVDLVMMAWARRGLRRGFRAIMAKNHASII
jgi:hypothetical protein